MSLRGSVSGDFPRWTCEQMFALATDIERYPSFIPWCQEARVVAEEDGVRVVDNRFGAGPVALSFRSRALATTQRLEISSEDGPFRHFRLTWEFRPVATGGCSVRAEYLVDFRSALLQGLARVTAREAERRVLARFHARARELYG